MTDNPNQQRILELERAADQARARSEPAAAIASYQEILGIEPNFVRAHLALALLCEKQGDYRTAIEHAERVIALEPHDALNMAALSVIYQRAFEATRDPIYIQKAEEAKARSR